LKDGRRISLNVQKQKQIKIEREGKIDSLVGLVSQSFIKVNAEAGLSLIIK